jgi:hypothetical protein
MFATDSQIYMQRLFSIKDLRKNLEGFARTFNYKNYIKPSRFIQAFMLNKESTVQVCDANDA